jgi:hypothetical protein
MGPIKNGGLARRFGCALLTSQPERRIDAQFECNVFANIRVYETPKRRYSSAEGQGQHEANFQKEEEGHQGFFAPMVHGVLRMVLAG